MISEIENGRVVHSLMRSLVGLSLLVLVAYLSERGIGRADAVERYSVGAGSLNWTAAGSWSAASCGLATVATAIPNATTTVVICGGTSVVVNATALAATVFVYPTGRLRGGPAATNALIIGNPAAISVVGIAINLFGGEFSAQAGSVVVVRNANTTVFSSVSAGAGTTVTFNNLFFAPSMNADRIYTLGGGSINRMTVRGDLRVVPSDVSAGAARVLTVNDGSLNSATILGDLVINAGDTGTSDDVVTFNAGGIPWAAARIVLGRVTAGPTSDLVGGGSTFTLNGGTGTLFTRNGTGRFTANTATVVTMISPGSVTLTSGAFDATSVSPFSVLIVQPAADSPVLQSFGAGSVTVFSRLSIGNGTNTGLVSAATNNTTLDVGGAVSISANATLIPPSTNPLLVAGNWVNAGTFSTALGTVTLDGAAAQQIIGVNTFLNLSSTNSSTGVTMAANQTVNGTLTLGTALFRIGANNTLTLNGPGMAGTGSATSLAAITAGTSSLVFGGNSSGVSLIIPASSPLNNLTVNNSVVGQNALTLNGNISVVGVLTMTDGVIKASPYTLTTLSACTGSVVSAGAGWVAGDLRMRFPAGPPTCIFPLGDTVSYTPIQLAFTVLGTAASLTASVLNERHRNTIAGTSGIDATIGIQRFWSLKNSTLAGTYTATFTYINPGDHVGATLPATNFIVRRGANCSNSGVSRTCTPWGALAVPTVRNTTTTTVTGITITADSPAEADFAIGHADPSTNFQREKQFIYTRELY